MSAPVCAIPLPCRGQLLLDAGAVHAVRDKHKSLFAAGIKKITGDFHAQVGKPRAEDMYDEG